jgi:glycerol-3-phosphate dehydrogenase
MVGTTDVPHSGDPEAAVCSAEEQAYLLAAYNRYFLTPQGPATAADIVYTFSGVRTLADAEEARPSRISRASSLACVANGSGGMIAIHGGKLTTHRALAEDVLDALSELGASIGPRWTRDAPLHGGRLSRDELLRRAEQGPAAIPYEVRLRWAFTYGDEIEALYAQIARDKSRSEMIASGVTRAELDYAVEVEDAAIAEDFLLRRTKLHLLLDRPGREAVAAWFDRPA